MDFQTTGIEQHNHTENFSHTILTKTGEIVYTVATSTIIFFGVTLNVLVILAYLTKRLEKTYFNLCLLNLSIANIGEHVGFILFLIFHTSKDDIRWGDGLAQKIMCGLTEGISLFFMSVIANAFVIVYMSILRYRMIVKVERFNEVITRTKTIFLILWITSAGMMVPNMLTMKYNKHLGMCIRTYDVIGELPMMLWGGFMFLLVYVTPMVVILFTHFRISLVMYTSSCSQFKSQVKMRHRNKVVLCLGITVVIFIVSWTPWATYWGLRIFGYFGNHLEAKYEMARIINWVLLPCLGPGIFNVFTYGIVNAQFRKAILDIFQLKKNVNTQSQIIPLR